MTGTDAALSILRSLEVGLLCALLGTPVAVATGWVLARRPFPGRTLVTTVLLLPLVLPPVVTGILLLEVFGRGGPLEALGVPFTLAGAVLAAFVVGLPFYVVSARNAFESLDPRYEEVSLTLGVPPIPTFLRVSLPLALPGIIAGAVLAFARALGEFGATIVLAGNVDGTRTIALAVYTLLEMPGEVKGMRLLLFASVTLAFLAMVGHELFTRWQRRRLEVHGEP